MNYVVCIFDYKIIADLYKKFSFREKFNFFSQELTFAKVL